MNCQRIPSLARMFIAAVVGLGSTLSCEAGNEGHGGGAGHAPGGYGYRGGYCYGFRGGFGYRGYYGYPGWYPWAFGVGLGSALAYDCAYPYYPYPYGCPVYVTPGYCPGPAANGPVYPVAAQGPAPGGPPVGAPVRLTDMDVLLSIRVPADAIVRINGEQTSQQGPRREFASSGLVPGRCYTFVVSARWAGANGQAMEREQRIQVRGGERRTVDFLTPSSPTQDLSRAP
jgi:uncharacterized protein (TIGR03000 family)